ncbi:MAG: efflux RND transporter periplasmic adaptor subunit [Acidobacteria bacterium]|nr:efflux RND transporter periplasmic adaptor subunit [Acidobacteriota bacterium]
MIRRNRRIIVIVAVAIATAAAGAGVLNARRSAAAPAVITDVVTRGPIVSTVSAMGTLEPVTTVDVGTQVSGTIQSLHADFNSLVKKGQVLARLDPALFRSAIEQAQANLTRAQAELDRLNVGLADAKVKRDRARELADRQLIPASELEGAEVSVRSAEAQARSAAAQVTQARAALRQAEVDQSKTVITSPIDGIVIARNVDVGQTVAASLQAPTLFHLAASLEEMQLKASVDESDVGTIGAGQAVTFTVDAHPQQTFSGRVQQVRLNPVVEQNVVTYAAIISAPNPELKLKPGLTAHATIEVARRENVLRVPSAALRFRPSDDVKKALGADGLSAEGPTVWQYTEVGLRPRSVRAGAGDGIYTEVEAPGLAEGARVVTRVMTEERAVTAAGSSPLMPSGPRLR